MKRKHMLVSLCAITPLLLHAEKNEEKSIALETTNLECSTQDAPMQQGYKSNGSSKDKLCPDPKMCMPDIEAHQINVRHIESGGIGYNKGYTTLEALFTLPGSSFIPFLDLRGHVFNDGRLAANIGIGTRFVCDASKSMVGINAYYDYRSLKGAHFNQCGVGLEGFFGRWELRLNGYLPVGEKKEVSEHNLNWISFKKFQGNNLLINENYTDKVYVAKKGGNLELGVHLLKIMRDYDCFVGIGPYYFGGEGQGAWGGKARIKAEIAKYLFLELSDSYDRLFKNNFQGTVMLSFPFGGKKCYPKKTRNAATSDCFADNIMVFRGVQPVERQEIIVVKKQTSTYTVDPIAINPQTEQPIFITFINNGAAPGGNGTFETPYNTLATAQANTGTGSVVYVFGTPTPYNGNWTLQDNQRLLGSATAHNFNTTKGVADVPPQTNLLPFINPGAGTPAIQTVGMFADPLTNFEISGMSAQQVSGVSAIATYSQNSIVSNNYILGLPAGTGQATVLARGIESVIMDNNISTGNPGNAGLTFVKDGFTNPSSTVNLTMSNNVSANNGTGISIFYDDAATGIVNANITNNVCSTNVNQGVFLIGSNGIPVTTNATISGNTIIDNGADGFVTIQLFNASLELFNNVSTHNGTSGTGSGMNFISLGTPSNLCVNIHDNITFNNVTAGYTIDNTGGTVTLAPFVRNVGNLVESGSVIPVTACPMLP